MRRFSFFVVCSVFALANAQDYLEELKQNGIKDLKPLCEKNADLATFESIKVGFDDFKKCGSSMGNPGVLAAAKTRAQWRQLLKSVCQKFPTSLKCIESFNAITRPCFTDEQFVLYSALTNITTTYVNTLCYDKTEEFIDFAVENGLDCFQENTIKILNCLAHVKVNSLSGPKDSFENDEKSTEKNCFKFDVCERLSTDEPIN